jgi:hypothetical protein
MKKYSTTCAYYISILPGKMIAQIVRYETVHNLVIRVESFIFGVSTNINSILSLKSDRFPPSVLNDITRFV